ncbi:HD domain-containing protein [uncultured Dysosmobacter sp.]|uniref:HD domain-containing protein n=1 Tax=uncultured Dysosmobacter sp. TaxID=2591384 RepID=UPI00262238ED|nr:HD domain-containing protein [uncultured Dysosmobacter sp.]
MNRLWKLYHREIPPFLQEFSAAPPMARLKAVGMNCGCEYTHFPRFAGIGPYSRYDHSLGVALIVWHFTGDRKQALAGLFHDIGTPVFAHVVDFLNGDHLRQESTEAGTAERITDSPELCALLERYGLTVEQTADYHQYPIADNPSPALSADRLEYTLGNALNYGFADMEQLRGFYEDLTVGEDEAGRPELVFSTPETAAAFTRTALRNARVYVADEDRFAMQSLADLLRLALDRGVLRREELWGTEGPVIQKLAADPVCGPAWRRFCGWSRILRSAECPGDGWLQVDAKKRWIDPLVRGMGRVSQWDMEVRKQLEWFWDLDFSQWLSAE